MDNSQDQIQGGHADRAKLAEHAEKSAMAQMERLRAAEKAHAQSISQAPDHAAELQKVQIRSAALQAALATSASLGPDEVLRSAKLFRDFLSGVAPDVTPDKPNTSAAKLFPPEPGNWQP